MEDSHRPPLRPDSEYLEDNDKTQPLEEHLDALRTLNNSQDTDIIDPPGLLCQNEVPRLAHSVVQARLQRNPLDVDSWLELVRLALGSRDHSRITDMYESLLKTFPNACSVQIAYVTYVLGSSDPAKHQTVAGLFNRFLKESPFVDLWKFYLSHVKQLNTDPRNRDTIRKAYEFVLSHMGHDAGSGEVWIDYIQLLKAWEVATTWDEGQKMDAIRKAYQRAIQVPTTHVKRLWEDYTEFETGINKQLAKKFLSDFQIPHMRACTAFNTLEVHLTSLRPTSPSTDSQDLRLPRPPNFSVEDKVLVARWKQYLKWEESNPLEIAEADKTQFRSRVQATYRKAVVCMRFFPEIWYMAYVWSIGVSCNPGSPESERKEKKGEALRILRGGIEANPKSFLLSFAYAEALEVEKNLAEVHNIFQQLIALLRSELETMEVSGSPTPDVHPGNVSLSQTDDASQSSRELRLRRTEYGVAWVMYMRFARRAESTRSARDVFAKARKDRWTPWEVYEAAARAEYHCTKAVDVAKRIFEKGMEKFPNEEEFALRYLSFLIIANDDTNARTLFERIAPTFPPERARPLWECWARYEYQYGSFQAAQDLEKKLAEVYPNDPSIKRFAERHRYLGVDTIAVRDLGFKFSPNPNNSRTAGHFTPRSLGPTSSQESRNSTSSSHQHTRFVSELSKRPSSPGLRGRDSVCIIGDLDPPLKKPRASSPSKERNEHGRRYQQDPISRQRHSPRPQERAGYDQNDASVKEEQDKDATLTPVLSWLLSVLPSPSSYDGPKFRADDMMRVLRNAVIPSTTGIRPAAPQAPSQSQRERRRYSAHSSYPGPPGRRRCG